jgi:hypothetical protein
VGFETWTAVFNDVRHISTSKGVSSYHGAHSFVFEVHNMSSI